jgi:hypothetical protein
VNRRQWVLFGTQNRTLGLAGRELCPAHSAFCCTKGLLPHEGTSAARRDFCPMGAMHCAIAHLKPCSLCITSCSMLRMSFQARQSTAPLCVPAIRQAMQCLQLRRQGEWLQRNRGGFKCGYPFFFVRPGPQKSGLEATGILAGVSKAAGFASVSALLERNPSARQLPSSPSATEGSISCAANRKRV